MKAKHMSARPVLVLSAIGLVAGVVACGNSIEANSAIGGSGDLANGGPNSGAAGTAGINPDAVSGNGTTGGTITIPVDDGTGTGTVVACRATANEALSPGLDFYMILDHSGSMGLDCPLSTTAPPVPVVGGMMGGGGGMQNNPKWCFASHALAQYFVSDAAAGHRAALQFMSLTNDFVLPAGADIGDYVCQAGVNNPHSTAAVPLTMLPVVATDPLITAIDVDGPGLLCDTNGVCIEDPNGLGTLIEPGLDGIRTFTELNRDPTRTMIGILITDGDPNNCEENDFDLLASIPGGHLAATQIPTYFIGMTGATLDNMEIMAAAGGAPEHTDFCGDGPSPCHYWSVGDGDPAAFVAALGQIVSSAVLPCEYLLPDPPIGQQLDSDLVNVTLTAPGLAPAMISRVASAAECGAGASWFYNDPANPDRIMLCPTACTQATVAIDGTTVDIAYGCMTLVE